MLLRNTILLIMLIHLAKNTFSQSKLDTLLINLKTAHHDTAVYNAYLELGNYFQTSNPDTAIYFHSKAEITAEKIPGTGGELRKGEAIRAKGWDYFMKSDYTKAMYLYETALKTAERYLNSTEQNIVYKAKKIWAASIGNIGVVFSNQGNYTKALEYYFKALSISVEIGDKLRQANNLVNIGLVFTDQGNYSKALEYYFKALSINEKIGNKQGQAINLGNIGLVFNYQSNYLKALEYYEKALKINEEMGNKHGQATNLANIGVVFKNQGNYSKALEYYFKALSIYEEIGDKRGQASILVNIGIVFNYQANYTKAFEYYFIALSINEELGRKQGQAINLGNIGSLYLKSNEPHKAEEYLKKAEALNRELGSIYYLEVDCQNLSQLYEKQGKYKDALFYYKEYTQAHDSLNSEQNQKALQTQELKYQYEKEQALNEAEHQKQLEIQRKEKEQQQVISYAIGSGLLLVIAFSILIFKRLQITRNQKRIIEKQKKTVEEQKCLVEEKNKEITDSITYAKRIQDAILPSDEKWKELLPDSFIYYLPKDIVAGDFYWLEETDDYIFVAAADCTGHGVPGAMVSVVCNNALNRSVREFNLHEPGKILDKTRELVVETFGINNNEIKDGMDIALCSIAYTKENNINKNVVLQYAGANRPLWIIEKNSNMVKEILADVQPIGKSDYPKPFTNHRILLHQGDTIYLFSDGFADQFGGEKGKKFKTTKLKELLLSIQSESIEEQNKILTQTFYHWKQNTEQVDDVTFIGIKI